MRNDDFKAGSLVHQGQPIVGWDWVRFVKRLGSYKTAEEDGEMADAQASLRNRRRMWRIIHGLVMLDGR